MIFVRVSYAQTNQSEKAELIQLLELRKQKFEAYSNSLEKHTGFFGNKTKNDMQRSNEVLTDLVRIDNKIIGTLNRSVDFKNYEKLNLNFKTNEKELRLLELNGSIVTLQKQVQLLKAENRYLTGKMKRYNAMLFIAVSLSLLLLFLLVKRLRKQ